MSIAMRNTTSTIPSPRVLLAISVSLLAIAGTLGSTGCSREARGATGTAAKGAPVRLAAVGVGGATTISGTGVLGAKDEIPLAFKIGGVVSRVTVDEGARVHAGQVLAELDLREIDAAVAKATAGAEKARRDAARAERLLRDSVTTLVQAQDAASARDAAEADLRSARVSREYAVIAAPGDGVILHRIVNPGAQLSSGSAVLVFGSAARGNVLRVGLADRDAVRVRAGDVAVVTFDAYAPREFRGRVRQVGAAADPRTGTYSIEVTVDGAAALPNGLVGHVRIASASSVAAAGTGAIGIASIPAEALVEGDGNRGIVYTIDAAGHRALKREVTLVGAADDRVLVRGLTGVTQVISAGAAWLRDSARVEVKP
jgi:multidrug efflux system membrane fusion protein